MADRSARTRPPAVRRLAGWLRWLGVPFGDLALALALVGATAAPAFLVSAADVWQDAAGDRIAGTLADGADPDASGIAITTLTTFTPAATRTADDLVTARLRAIDGLGEVRRFQYTFRNDVFADPPLPPAGAPVRLFAADGAVDAIEIVDRADVAEPSVWISTWFAERSGLRPGDVVYVPAPLDPNQVGAEIPGARGPTVATTVAGTYEPVWDGDAAPYWEDVPPDLVPRFLRPFNAPAFSLFVLDPATMEGLAVSGATRWTAPAVDVPRDIGGLRSMVGAYRALEVALTTDPDLAAALDDLAAGLGDLLDDDLLVPIPETGFDSTLPSTLAEAEAALVQLDQPLASARTAGVAVGLVIMVASAVFVVQRRRSEYVLLAGEGDRWWRFAPRAFAQLTLPGALGTTLGVIAAAEVGHRVGPATGFDLSPVDVVGTAGVVAAGTLLAALTTGVIAQATLDRGVIGARPHLLTSVVSLLSLVAAGFLWAVVGSSTSTGTVDVSVVAFPLVGLVAAASTMAWAIGSVTRRNREAGRRLPLVAWLAVRRLGTRSDGPRIVAAAGAVGIGLVVFSTMLVASLDETVDAKLATEVGGASRVSVLTSDRTTVELPPDSTIVSTSRSRITGRGEVVTLVAVDPATLPEAVFWPDAFGADLGRTIERLATPLDGTLPVVAVASQPTPDSGAVGTTRTVPFQVVDRVRSFPLADDFGISLLVDVDRLDALERARVADVLGVPLDDPAVDDAFVPPSTRATKHVVSMLPLDRLVAQLEDQGLVARDGLDRAERAVAVDVLAPGFAFDYLRLLGAVAAAAAIAGLLLHLAERRDSRALTAVITRRMGLRPRRAALVTTVEIGALSAVATLTAAVTAPFITARLLPRFDPNPALPPQVAVGVPGWEVVIAVVGIITLLAAVVWASELRWSRLDHGEVLRAID
ncbi:MAG: hypothetical protein R3290_00470 [Acidimicrobiia bacterium]|nr:hypothetical protein [Acidimicrobiia bacterium]